jgi:murein L,D-transpeptidase YafK
MLGLLLFSAILPFGEDATAQRALASALPNDTTVRKNTKSAKTFSNAQLRNDRVLAARYEKRFAIKQLFRDRNIPYPAEEVFIRIFKRERILELWARGEAQDTFALLKRYEICALGGELGPKRRQGDMQTPEGFYYIDDFNPRSGFHLSLHINYPNRADQVLGKANDLGGDIFIHGGCKTEGCMAVTDENIKEIYWIAVEARDNGQKRIPVHIFPARLTDNNLAQLANVFHERPDLVTFWTNLKPGYDYFAKYKVLPEVKVIAGGRYVLEHSAPPTLLGQPTAAQSEAPKGN